MSEIFEWLAFVFLLAGQISASIVAYEFQRRRTRQPANRKRLSFSETIAFQAEAIPDGGRQWANFQPSTGMNR
jgi:hypothetical protein